MRSACSTPRPDQGARHVPVILTPHAGEFDALFGKSDADKIDARPRRRRARRRDRRLQGRRHRHRRPRRPRPRRAGASAWLSTAGTGDVLAGAIAAMLAAGLDPLDAACAGVWLHGDAARRLGAAFIADDLARALSAERRACLVTTTDTIVRVAARGDGITADGRHAALAAPGDTLAADGTVIARPAPPDAALPPFPDLRRLPAPASRRRRPMPSSSPTASPARSTAQDLSAPNPPAAPLAADARRRRATLHAEAKGGRITLGFTEEQATRSSTSRNATSSRRELFALVAPLRELLARLDCRTRRADIHLTLADQGVDLLIDRVRARRPRRRRGAHRLLRKTTASPAVAIDDGLGPETRWEPEPVTITLGGVPVPLPPGVLPPGDAPTARPRWSPRCARRSASRATVADLFAGLGTFALALPGKVYAAEGARDAHRAR